ncbi:MAG: non-ribosomal peptide synthetase, partial [Mycobacterium sp.]|nr:non-ribosomal peptide synthetase [Mycobacterium sp.]
PIANTTLHILDRHGVPAPPGVSGELHIAGTGLALGYVGQPELTAERFAPIDTADRGRVFAYRTGDLARLLSDGTVELRGRIDDQMKIRGHRVEPEEIEHTIRAHPHVRDVVVVLTAQQQLVAHVLTEPGVAVTESELSRFAARGLRPVLVPQRFVTHPELPRTANGKLDRARLRAVELPQPVSTGVEEPPRTSDERLVASVYEDILGVRPHRDDSFFGLGGHSLAATRALARLEQICGARIPLHTFMQDASVATVAGHLSTTADDDLLAALALVESMSEQDAVDILDTSDEKADNR